MMDCYYSCSIGLISVINKQMSAPENGSAATGEGVRRRREQPGSNGTANADSSSQNEPSYTQEQVAAVNRCLY